MHGLHPVNKRLYVCVCMHMCLTIERCCVVLQNACSMNAYNIQLPYVESKGVSINGCGAFPKHLRETLPFDVIIVHLYVSNKQNC